MSYQWDFGDGGADTGRFPTHSYILPGNYTVNLSVKGVSGNSTVSKIITVKPPLRVSINAAKVTNMPFLDPSCNCGWDVASSPDVFFKLTDNANSVLATGRTYTDASAASLPLLWNYSGANYTPDLNYEVTDFNKIYKFNVYDADAPPVDPDDLIGSISFNFASYPTATGYPQSIILNAPFPSTLTVQLEVRWIEY